MESSDGPKQRLFFAPHRHANNLIGQPNAFPAIHQNSGSRNLEVPQMARWRAVREDQTSRGDIVVRATTRMNESRSETSSH